MHGILGAALTDITWAAILSDMAGFLTAIAPGWPSVVSGLIAASVGTYVFRRFVRVGR